MKKFLKKVFRFILIAIVVVFLATWHLGYREYQKVIADVPLKEKLEKAQEDLFYRSYDQIPTIFLDAIVAVEDERFYTRNTTLDFVAVARAMWVNLRSLSFIEGGSTIPQQVVKNLYFSHEVNPTRKVAEYYLAKDLLQEISKERILETYVNIIYYGNGAYSVGEASERYFGRPLKALNDSELTLLAGLPNAPSVYDLTQNFELARQRQSHVLSRLVHNGFITDLEKLEIEQLEVRGYE